MVRPSISCTLRPWGITAANAPVLVSNCCLFAVIMWVSWMQVSLVFRAGCIGGHIPYVEVLKVGALDVWSKPFVAQGEAGGWSFSASCMSLCWRCCLWWECLSFSYPLHHDCILTYPVCGGCSTTFWILFSGNCFMYSCTLNIHMVEGEFRSLLYCYLGPSTTIILIFNLNTSFRDLFSSYYNN